ncbi:aspartate/glutamate racemase family protein [Aureimonas sp. OT7]|uniref:aspartate/glutamate racemase family protein n=1 Tax=Aureimonas sp. OT7 TaxID=2816454 RepID=UPI001783E6A5|nr:aspartate/glutamate racemase family protein [Aureimonas sp. OT7]QOG05505.1 aspartate/glutamate racemase family protein [Aureimonas sp. OT7]
MDVIGLIGGMSWESSAEYYRLLNRGVRAARGPTASAQCILWSFDFAEIERRQHADDWEGLAALMVDAAERLDRAGADVIALCTNTMHRLAPEIEVAVPGKLIHIADPTGQRIAGAGYNKVGLLGTAFTMEQDFYKGRLADRFGLDVIVPDAEDRATVHRIIYEELVAGIVDDGSRSAYRAVIARLVEAGAQAIILGCTEIMLLVGPDDSSVPVFDTTAIHVDALVEAALASA